jgi:hypothetical protein
MSSRPSCKMLLPSVGPCLSATSGSIPSASSRTRQIRATGRGRANA